MEIQEGALYKVKNGCTVDSTEECLSSIVRVLSFARNPLISKYEDSVNVIFTYVFEKSLNSTSALYPLRVLNINAFEENFELYKTWQEANEIVRNLDSNR